MSLQVVLHRLTPSGGQNFPVCVDLGLAYLLKALEQNGVEAAYHDGVLHPTAADDLLARYGRDEPWLLGLKLYSHQIGPARALLRRLKDRNPRIVAVLGGPHPSGLVEQVFATVPEADYAFVGEGEPGLPRLAREGASPGDWRGEVPGLIWRDGETVRANPPDYVADLDAFGEAPWDRVGLAEYLPYRTPIRNAALVPIHTSRGCAFHCTYCMGHRLTGHRVRYRSPERVVAEIARLRRDYGVESVSIQDDNFTSRREHVVGFCEALLRAGLGVRWDCLSTGVRLDALDADLLRLMERSGCHALSLAVESANQEVLDDMRKGTKLTAVAETIRLIKRETRLTTNGYFILGYPTETRRTVANSIRFARRAGLDYALFFLFSPLPGTEITARLQRAGRLGDIDWESFQYDAPSVPLPDLSRGGLKRRQLWAYLSFYLRPRAFWRLLRTAAGAGQRGDLRRRLASLLGRRASRES
ncbi:MAG: radical SAM protein [Myxococcales bacterium]|nr:radical SAM protein [Myxococcales bacterium]